MRATHHNSSKQYFIGHDCFVSRDQTLWKTNLAVDDKLFFRKSRERFCDQRVSWELVVRFGKAGWQNAFLINHSIMQHFLSQDKDLVKMCDKLWYNLMDWIACKLTQVIWLRSVISSPFLFLVFHSYYFLVFRSFFFLISENGKAWQEHRIHWDVLMIATLLTN